jgi:hypothetical protein
MEEVMELRIYRAAHGGYTDVRGWGVYLSAVLSVEIRVDP